MRAQHELLHVDARHLWLTRQENRGKRSQNHDAKLTRPFLRVGRGWLARLRRRWLAALPGVGLIISNSDSYPSTSHSDKAAGAGQAGQAKTGPLFSALG